MIAQMNNPVYQTRRDHTKQDDQQHNHIEEWIIANTLTIDPSYQRTVRPAWVRQIADNFDPFLLDPLVVSRRENGQIAVMDGQHRLMAIRQIGYHDQRVPCLVYTGLSIEEEARRFNTQDARKNLTPQERFHSALIQRDPQALLIDATVRACGFEINLADGEMGHGRIPGVAALVRIETSYTNGTLRDVLLLLRDGFGTEQGPRHTLMAGTASFLSRYREDYDRKRLVSVLRRMTMDRLTAEGTDIARVLGIQTADGVGRSIVKAYNDHLRENRLPDWELTGKSRKAR